MSAQDPRFCIEVHPTLAFRSAYNSPFERSADFREGWWDNVPRAYDNGDMEFLSFRIADSEVARARISLNKQPGSDYGVPWLASGYAELERLEVASRYRQPRTGIGTRAIQAVIDRHRDVGLLAYSEGADGFWDTLGWHRFEHPDGMPSGRPLYVRPPES